MIWWMTYKLLHLPGNNWPVVPDDSHVSATIKMTSKHLPEFYEKDFYVTGGRGKTYVDKKSGASAREITDLIK